MGDSFPDLDFLLGGELYRDPHSLKGVRIRDNIIEWTMASGLSESVGTNDAYGTTLMIHNDQLAWYCLHGVNRTRFCPDCIGDEAWRRIEGRRAALLAAETTAACRPGLFARLWAWLNRPKPFLMKPRWWRRSKFA